MTYVAVKRSEFIRIEFTSYILYEISALDIRS